MMRVIVERVKQVKWPTRAHLIEPVSTIPRPRYFIAANRTLKRDFFRSAVALWTTPALAALSKAEVIARNASVASLFLPAVTRARNFFSSECNRDLRRRLCACLRALLRMRRSADLVFGINLSFKIGSIKGCHASPTLGFVKPVVIEGINALRVRANSGSRLM